MKWRSMPKIEKQQAKMLKFTVIIMMIIGFWHFVSIYAVDSIQPFHNDGNGPSSSDVIGMEREDEDDSVFSINILENTLYEDKEMRTYRPVLRASSQYPASAFGTQHTLQKLPNDVVPASAAADDDNDELHKHLLHDINKSNQENTNFHNRPPQHIHVRGNGKTEGEYAESSEILTSSSSNSTDSSASAYFERVELRQSKMLPASKDKLLLHRRKRYLIFPEGSSFQLVFDLIIPIVDYTNFAIMGITCAVAWELPSKPPSEIIENFQHKLNDGTFGLSRRNDSVHQQLQYITDQTYAERTTAGGNNQQQQQQWSELMSAPVATTSAHQSFPARNFFLSNTLKELPPAAYEPIPHYPYNQPPKNDNYLEMVDKSQRTTFHAGLNGWPVHRDSHKWSSPQMQQTKASTPDPTYASTSWTKDNWWERNKDRIENQWQNNQRKWQSYGEQTKTQRTARNRIILTNQPKHRIYPVFGKRRKRSNTSQFSTKYSDQGETDDDDDLANKLHEFHAKEHLHTRHKLYGKIEKLYKTRGHNGTACVLRTLCETHKEQHKHRRSQAPRTFVMELLRAIFTLPQDTLTTLKLTATSSYMDSPYTDAALHVHKIPTCSQHYNGCEHPIWHGVEF